MERTTKQMGVPQSPRVPGLQGATDDLMATYAAGYDASIRWDKVNPWLRKTTTMEIWLKGVFTAEDVQLAIEHGVDGVVCSNHGGRQLDGQPATLDALRECGPIARGSIPLAMDGGVRSGADIFKALALAHRGASWAVFRFGASIQWRGLR